MASKQPPEAVVDVETEAIVKVSQKVRLAVIGMERRGRLTAENLVDAARHPDSPLHHCFEWDDTKAAEDWRLEQARRVIRGVKMLVEEETTTIAVPNYVRDPSREGDEQGYISIGQLQREPANAASLMRYEITRCVGIFDRVVRIAEALKLRGEAVDVLAKIKRLLEKVQ